MTNKELTTAEYIVVAVGYAVATLTALVAAAKAAAIVAAEPAEKFEQVTGVPLVLAAQVVALVIGTILAGLLLTFLVSGAMHPTTKKVAKAVAWHPATKVADNITNLLLKVTVLSLAAGMSMDLAAYLATPALENLSELAGVNPAYALTAFNVACVVAVLATAVKLVPATLEALLMCFDE